MASLLSPKELQKYPGGHGGNDRQNKYACVCAYNLYIYIPYVVVSERMAVRPFIQAQLEIRCNFTSKWGNGSLNPSSFPTKSAVSYIPLYPHVSHPTVLQRHIKSNSVKKTSLQRKEGRGQTDFTGKSSCNLFNFLPSKSAS